MSKRYAPQVNRFETDELAVAPEPPFRIVAGAR
jgi:hypothetical protein